MAKLGSVYVGVDWSRNKRSPIVDGLTMSERLEDEIMDVNVDQLVKARGTLREAIKRI
jgi:hypothetical protein